MRSPSASELFLGVHGPCKKQKKGEKRNSLVGQPGAAGCDRVLTESIGGPSPPPTPSVPPPPRPLVDRATMPHARDAVAVVAAPWRDVEVE
jgi:hypothetical protein